MKDEQVAQAAQQSTEAIMRILQDSLGGDDFERIYKCAPQLRTFWDGIRQSIEKIITDNFKANA